MEVNALHRTANIVQKNRAENRHRHKTEQENNKELESKRLRGSCE